MEETKMNGYKEKSPFRKPLLILLWAIVIPIIIGSLIFSIGMIWGLFSPI